MPKNNLIFSYLRGEEELKKVQIEIIRDSIHDKRVKVGRKIIIWKQTLQKKVIQTAFFTLQRHKYQIPQIDLISS
jgi:hypothetical protein